MKAAGKGSGFCRKAAISWQKIWMQTAAGIRGSILAGKSFPEKDGRQKKRKEGEPDRKEKKKQGRNTKQFGPDWNLNAELLREPFDAIMKIHDSEKEESKIFLNQER